MWVSTVNSNICWSGVTKVVQRAVVQFFFFLIAGRFWGAELKAIAFGKFTVRRGLSAGGVDWSLGRLLPLAAGFLLLPCDSGSSVGGENVLGPALELAWSPRLSSTIAVVVKKNRSPKTWLAILSVAMESKTFWWCVNLWNICWNISLPAARDRHIFDIKCSSSASLAGLFTRVAVYCTPARAYLRYQYSSHFDVVLFQAKQGQQQNKHGDIKVRSHYIEIRLIDIEVRLRCCRQGRQIRGCSLPSCLY